MNLHMKLCVIGVGFAMINAVINMFIPTWASITLITISMCFTGVGMIVLRRSVRRQELLRKMEAAFGVSPNRVQ